jgi:hypothetical protein
MKVRVYDLKMALDYIYKMYSVGADSAATLTIQEDDPGDGKICDILSVQIGSKDGTTSLSIEMYGDNENRPPTSVYTKKLVHT